jgi:hypothetical protein
MKFDANSRERERERELEKEERERGRCESVDYRKIKGKEKNNPPLQNSSK